MIDLDDMRRAVQRQIKWGKLIPVSEITELIAEVERLRGVLKFTTSVLNETIKCAQAEYDYKRPRNATRYAILRIKEVLEKLE